MASALIRRNDRNRENLENSFSIKSTSIVKAWSICVNNKRIIVMINRLKNDDLIKFLNDLLKWFNPKTNFANKVVFAIYMIV
jgi:hypothetical protein